MGPTSIGENLERIFLGIGVEVTDKQSWGSIKTLSKSGKCPGLLHTNSIGVTLPVTVVGIRGSFCTRQVLRRGPLRLKVVGDNNEILALVVCIGDRLKFLSKRLASKARVCGVIKND